MKTIGKLFLFGLFPFIVTSIVCWQMITIDMKPMEHILLSMIGWNILYYSVMGAFYSILSIDDYYSKVRKRLSAYRINRKDMTDDEAKAELDIIRRMLG